MLRGARRRLFPHAADPPASEGKRQYLSDARQQPDPGVRWLVWGLGVIQAALVVRPLAGWVANRLSRGQPGHSTNFNYAYVIGWLVVLAAFWVGPNFSQARWPLLAAAGVGLYRYVEIVVWWLKALFDRGHRFLISVERNLLFLLLDAFAVITTVAYLFRAGVPSTAGSKDWITALTAVTLSGAPDLAEAGVWVQLGVVAATFGGLLLIASGLASLVGLIADKFEAGEGAYTGSLRPPPPTRRWR